VEELERVTTKQAAAELHMSILTLQTLMQQGILPIGVAVKRKQKYQYVIYRNMLEDYKRNQTNLMKAIGNMGKEAEGFLKVICMRMMGGEEDAGSNAGRSSGTVRTGCDMADQ